MLPRLSTPGPNYGRGGSPAKRGVRRERDDKVHESIIEERIQRERPCRTLFIRNIKASLESCLCGQQVSSVQILLVFEDPKLICYLVSL